MGRPLPAPARGFVPLVVPLGAAVVVLVTVLALLALASAPPANLDDAFVVLVYARGLLEGAGFIYNSGEAPIDGFTSFLDLILKTGAIWAFPRDPIRVVWAVTTVTYLAASLVAVACAAALARRATRGARAWLAGALALALCPGLADGASFMLGTPLFVLLLAPAALVVPEPRDSQRADFAAAALSVAVVWTRPEGLAVVAFLLALRARRGRGAARWRSAAIVGATLAMWVAWRWSVFGHLAPNSYYAKTSDARLNEIRDGLRYVGEFVTGASAGSSAGPVARAVSAAVGATIVASAIAAPLSGARARFSDPRAQERFAALAWSGLVALAVVVISGGDCYVGARFLAPVALLTLLALVQGAAWGVGQTRSLSLGALVVVGGLRAAEVLPNAPALANVASAPWSADDFACSRHVSRVLAEIDPVPRVAHRHFQRLKYFAPELVVIDLTGLNHAQIARMPAPQPVRFGRDAIPWALEHDVEVLHLDPLWTSPGVLAERPLAQVLEDPELARRFFGEPLGPSPVATELAARYTSASLVDACGAGRHFNVLVRRDQAQRFAAAGFRIGG